MTLPDIPNVTFLQDSGVGFTPLTLPDGRVIDPCGLALALASLSARQVKALGLRTSGIYGPPGSTSSRSAALQSSLESRLRARTQILGSTLYTLTWKAWVTPSGVSRSRLRASVRRTSETAITGGPTPTTADGSGGGQAKRAMGETRHGSNLNDFAMLAGCPTPMAGTPAQNGNNAAGNNDSSRRTVALAGWPTPTVGNSKGSQSCEGMSATGRMPDGRKVAVALPHVANMAGWGTPLTNHANGTPEAFLERKRRSMARGSQSMGVCLSDLNMQVQAWVPTQPARFTASGVMLIGSDARMESGGQLNPEHSRWLMGIPAVWGFCALTATLSSRKSLRRSSKPRRK